MREVLKSTAVRIALTIAAVLSTGQAFAFDLTGAWASERDACGLVFEKKGSAVDFTQLSDLYGSGFIVNGDAIKGKAARCTVKSRRQDGDATVLTADCATSIMTSTVQFRYKVIDDNTLARDFVEIKGMSIKYSRCPL